MHEMTSPYMAFFISVERDCYPIGYRICTTSFVHFIKNLFFGIACLGCAMLWYELMGILVPQFETMQNRWCILVWLSLCWPMISLSPCLSLTHPGRYCLHILVVKTTLFFTMRRRWLTHWNVHEHVELQSNMRYYVDVRHRNNYLLSSIISMDYPKLLQNTDCQCNTNKIYL